MIEANRVECYCVEESGMEIDNTRTGPFERARLNCNYAKWITHYIKWREHHFRNGSILAKTISKPKIIKMKKLPEVSCFKARINSF